MQYESAAAAAERLGVTVRAVQKWAKDGRLIGAKKVGRDWMIPVTTGMPIEQIENINLHHGKVRFPMPLLSGSYPIGECREFIADIEDEDDRNIALGEYYFFSGKAELAAQTVERYLDCDDESLKFSSRLIYVFANLSRGHFHLSRFALNGLKEELEKGLKSNSRPEIHAIGIFAATTAAVLLHLPIPNTVPSLDSYLKYLKGGLKLYACYVLAHKAYLDGNYEKCLTTASMAVDLCPERYPVAEIYCRIVQAMALVNMRRTDEAKEQIKLAWEIAGPDGLIEAFGEHHGLLQGLIEVFFKTDYPEDFKNIIEITYAFSASWRKIHNPDTNHDVADNLTTTEFTVAMLYNRGWKVKEIALHMNMSERMVHNHIRYIFEKLNINSKKQLSAFMLK